VTAWLLVTFTGGVLSHKVWRVVWRVRRHPVSWGDAVAAEFAPPEPEAGDRKQARTPSPTEIG
jgi:hypothetical protein